MGLLSDGEEGLMRSVRSRVVGVVVLVAAVVWMLVPGAASAAKPITVCASGCSYTSVQAAVNAAPSGATISIAAGTYLEAVAISKSVTLVGAGAGATILAFPDSPFPARTVSIDAGEWRDDQIAGIRRGVEFQLRRRHP